MGNVVCFFVGNSAVVSASVSAASSGVTATVGRGGGLPWCRVDRRAVSSGEACFVTSRTSFTHGCCIMIFEVSLNSY